eukprot:SAG22_NODE_2402_length_2615_cov_3.309618_6_plen_50_part_01
MRKFNFWDGAYGRAHSSHLGQSDPTQSLLKKSLSVCCTLDPPRNTDSKFF